MYYPGQPVYILKEKTIGIFIGNGTETGMADTAFYVTRLNNDDILEPDLMSLDEIRPLIIEDKDTITKQRIYYGPVKNTGKRREYTLRRKAWNSTMTDEEYECEKTNMEALIRDLFTQTWVKEKYKLEPTTGPL